MDDKYGPGNEDWYFLVQAGEEAVVRWEESKKWQKMVDRLKTRLKDREGDLERLTKAHEMTKNVLDR